jgi:hypothetical protein
LSAAPLFYFALRIRSFSSWNSRKSFELKASTPLYHHLNANYRVPQRNYQSAISFKPRKENDKCARPADARIGPCRHAPLRFHRLAILPTIRDPERAAGEASLPTIPLGSTMAVPQNA